MRVYPARQPASPRCLESCLTIATRYKHGFLTHVRHRAHICVLRHTHSADWIIEPCFTGLWLIWLKDKWQQSMIKISTFSHRSNREHIIQHEQVISLKNLLCICVFTVSTSSLNNSMNKWINKSSFSQEMWIYCRCHSCQCLCPGHINGCRDWRKVWNALNEAPYLSFLVPQMHTIRQAVEHHCLSITLLVEWPVSFLNLFGLICSLPVMLWERGLKSFSLPSWQVALTPYAKLTSWNTACFNMCSACNRT